MPSGTPGAQPPFHFPEGATLGPYRLEGMLGQGGMSTVFRAVQTSLNRPVALKVLPPEFAADQTLVGRFLQEARAAAALQHPHIIPIYDSGQIAGHYYIAMRYVDGMPLARAILENGFSVARALAIIEQIASALDYAHARGVVHRDVSAGNVMLEAGDRVTLMDFGIAQARQSSRLTRAGVAVGTLEYLSPEQARGEAATARSDIYALGVLSYEMLCGKLPFRAADDRALLLQHLNTAPPSLRQLRPDVPAGIDAAIQRCLAKDPRQRFPSAGAFSSALRAALSESRQRPGAAPAGRAALAPAPARSAPAGPAPAPARPAPRAVPPARSPVVTVPPSRRTLFPQRRLPIWALVGVLILCLALLGGTFAQRLAGTMQPGPVASPPSGQKNGLNNSQTAIPVAVHPARPQDAVQGFYAALDAGLLNGHNPTDLSRAYAYLSPTAQFQLPFADFQRQYAADSSVRWQYTNPVYTPAQQSVSVPVTLTEFRSSGNVTSSFVWVVVADANGWRLDHTATAKADRGRDRTGAGAPEE